MEEFSRTISLFGKEKFEKISKAKAAIVGIGGVGSYAAEALARTGVADLIIIDDDKIEKSNINRQVWALNSTVGKFKVDVAKKRLLDINPKIKITARAERLTKESAAELLPENIDIVIDAIDSLRDKAALIEHCLRSRITVISCMGAARRTDPTKIRIGKISNKKISGPLIKKLRKELRKINVPFDFPVVFSEEKAADVEMGTPLPSCCFTAGAVGFAAASYTCDALMQRENYM